MGRIPKLALVAVFLAMGLAACLGKCIAQEEYGAQPPNDSKWYVSVVGLPGCRPCARLDRDLETVRRLKEEIGSQNLTHWTYGSDKANKQFANLNLTSFPSIVFQPPEDQSKSYVVTGYTSPDALIREFERIKREHQGAQSVSKEKEDRSTIIPHPLQREVERHLPGVSMLADWRDRFQRAFFWSGVGLLVGLVAGCYLTIRGFRITL